MECSRINIFKIRWKVVQVIQDEGLYKCIHIYGKYCNHIFYIHMYMYTYTYACMCIHMCVCMCVYVYVYICICMCVYALCVCGIEKIKSMGNKWPNAAILLINVWEIGEWFCCFSLFLEFSHYLPSYSAQKFTNTFCFKITILVESTFLSIVWF